MRMDIKMASSNTTISFECADTTPMELSRQMRVIADMLSLVAEGAIEGTIGGFRAKGKQPHICAKLNYATWADNDDERVEYEGNIILGTTVINDATEYDVCEAFWSLVKDGKTFGEIGKILAGRCIDGVAQNDPDDTD